MAQSRLLGSANKRLSKWEGFELCHHQKICWSDRTKTLVWPCWSLMSRKWSFANSSLFSSRAGRTSELWSRALLDLLSTLLVITCAAASTKSASAPSGLASSLQKKKRRIPNPHQLLSGHIWCIVRILELTSPLLNLLPVFGTHRFHQHGITIRVFSFFRIGRAKGRFLVFRPHCHGGGRTS